MVTLAIVMWAKTRATRMACHQVAPLTPWARNWIRPSQSSEKIPESEEDMDFLLDRPRVKERQIEAGPMGGVGRQAPDFKAGGANHQPLGLQRYELTGSDRVTSRQFKAFSARRQQKSRPLHADEATNA